MRLLSAQFLVGALEPGHPSHKWVTGDHGRRRCKETLRTKLLTTVEPYLRNGTTPRGAAKESKKAIHTDIVRDTKSRLDPNRVLLARPPAISKKEKPLPRLTRVTLAQLRSGHCARLKDFQLRIGKAVDDLCPDCNLVTQTVTHLFQCSAQPTPPRWALETSGNAQMKLPSFSLLFLLSPSSRRRRRLRHQDVVDDGAVLLHLQHLRARILSSLLSRSLTLFFSLLSHSPLLSNSIFLK